MFGYAPLTELTTQDTTEQKPETEEVKTISTTPETPGQTIDKAKKLSNDLAKKFNPLYRETTHTLTYLLTWLTPIEAYFKGKHLLERNSTFKSHTNVNTFRTLQINAELLIGEIQNHKNFKSNYKCYKQIFEFLDAELYTKCPDNFHTIRDNIKIISKRLKREFERISKQAGVVLPKKISTKETPIELQKLTAEPKLELKR